MKGKYPLVTAHAGCLDTPSNSMANLGAAMESGSDIIEVDLRSTLDGRVVLTHDDTIRLPDGTSAFVHSLLWAHIEEALLNSTEYIITLEKILDHKPLEGFVLNLDVKDHDALLAAAKILRQRHREDTVFFSGLDLEGIHLAHERLPDFLYLFNADQHIVIEDALEGMKFAYKTARQYSCCGINLNWRKADEKMMEYARKRFMPVLLWTVDDEPSMRKCLSLGPYSITTNRPDLLTTIVSEL